MTREEAKELSIGIDLIFTADIFVDKIFDDLENRTCKNCKYSELGSNTYWCDLMKLNFTTDFGCNLFEKK